jgi:hypothetical protein
MLTLFSQPGEKAKNVTITMTDSETTISRVLRQQFTIQESDDTKTLFPVTTHETTKVDSEGNLQVELRSSGFGEGIKKIKPLNPSVES